MVLPVMVKIIKRKALLLSTVCCFLAFHPIFAAASNYCHINDLGLASYGTETSADIYHSEIEIEDLDSNRWTYYAIQKNVRNSDTLILFLHGFPEYSWSWESQIAHFGENYHAVAIDLKGFHRSSKPDEVAEYDLIELSSEIREIIYCLGYRKAILVGHDLGGALTWVMGMLQPDVIEKMIVMSVAHPYLFARALMNENSDQSYRSRYINHAQGTSAKDDVMFFRLIAQDGYFFKNDFYKGERRKKLFSEHWLPFSNWWDMRNIYKAFPIPPSEIEFPKELVGMLKTMYTVKRPTLLLRGANDKYFSREAYENMDDVVPQLEQYVYPDGSHWIHHEMSDINVRIQEFLHPSS